MTNEQDIAAGHRKDSIRIIFEGVIIALLVWVGNSILSLRTEIAVAQSQLVDIRANFSNINKIQTDLITDRAEINQLKRELEELKQTR